MIGLVMALQLASAPLTGDDFTNQEACEGFKEVAEAVNAEGPIMVDTVTRSDLMIVSCALKTVVWKKTLLADVSQLRPGWEARKQVQWNEAICNDPLEAPLVARGWGFVQDLTLNGGHRVKMEAVCEAE